MHASELIECVSDNAGRAALVVIIDVRGSSPRHPGSKMVVFADGTFLGTVGGGIVEARAIAQGVEAIASGKSRRLTVEMTGEQALGSDPICGGVVTLAVLPIVDATAYRTAAEYLCNGERIVLVSSIGEASVAASCDACHGNASHGVASHGESDNDESGHSTSVVLGADGSLRFGSRQQVDEEAMRAAFQGRVPVVSMKDGCLYDPVEPLDRLLILGGGHVGQALARFASELDFRVCVADSRPAFVDPSRFPEGTELRLGGFPEIIDAYPFGASTYAVVVSPSHSSDLECARAILKREYRYAGFIGSKRKTRMILDQAIADGFAREKVLALRAPIGADIGAETPAEIAIAILTEIVAVRRNSPAILAMDADRARRRA